MRPINPSQLFQLNNIELLRLNTLLLNEDPIEDIVELLTDFLTRNLDSNNLLQIARGLVDVFPNGFMTPFDQHDSNSSELEEITSNYTEDIACNNSCSEFEGSESNVENNYNQENQRSVTYSYQIPTSSKWTYNFLKNDEGHKVSSSLSDKYKNKDNDDVIKKPLKVENDKKGLNVNAKEYTPSKPLNGPVIDPSQPKPTISSRIKHLSSQYIKLKNHSHINIEPYAYSKEESNQDFTAINNWMLDNGFPRHQSETKSLNPNAKSFIPEFHYGIHTGK